MKIASQRTDEPTRLGRGGVACKPCAAAGGPGFRDQRLTTFTSAMSFTIRINSWDCAAESGESPPRGFGTTATAPDSIARKLISTSPASSAALTTTMGVGEDSMILRVTS